jgi:hypothetical protein
MTDEALTDEEQHKLDVADFILSGNFRVGQRVRWWQKHTRFMPKIGVIISMSEDGKVAEVDFGDRGDAFILGYNPNVFVHVTDLDIL